MRPATASTPYLLFLLLFYCLRHVLSALLRAALAQAAQPGARFAVPSQQQPVRCSSSNGCCYCSVMQCNAVQWHSQCDLSLTLLLPLLLQLLPLHDCCLVLAHPSPLLLVSHSEPLSETAALCRQHHK
jgi:hypothetical protein